MLYKEVTCPKCGGVGFISKVGDDSVWSMRCTECTGGTVLAPVTNGDIIRRCTNEELAKVHIALAENALYSGVENRRLLTDTYEDFLLWLDKPVEDLDMQTIFEYVDKTKYEHIPFTKVVNAGDKIYH